MIHFYHAHKAIIDASAITLAYFGITMSDVNEGGKFIVTILTIGYMSWKWITEYYAKKK